MKKYEYNNQPMFVGNDAYAKISDYIKEDDRIFLIHGKSYEKLPIKEVISQLSQEIIEFTGFSPNPKYEEVVAGRELFLQEKCTIIISVGGGSAIDTAKNIKLFAAMDNCNNYLESEKKASNVRHLAIPTTAGTGSESNRNSVLYKEGVKQSIKHESLLPDVAFIIPELIYTLPEYQKKSTMMDALCQCFESIWAAGSTDESRSYAIKGLQLVLEHMEAYLKGDKSSCEAIMLSANFSGRGTNISQTTAAHAMSYKLASLYNISHGHAVSLCLPYICEYAIDNMDKISDNVAENEIAKRFRSSEDWFEDTMFLLLGILSPGSTDLKFIAKRMHEIVGTMNFDQLHLRDKKDIDLLVSSVNPLRLGNNPVKLDDEALKEIYKSLFD